MSQRLAHPPLWQLVLLVVAVACCAWGVAGQLHHHSAQPAPAAQHTSAPITNTKPGLSVPASFTLRDKIGQLLFVGVFNEQTATDLEKNYQIGGFLLRPGGDLFSSSATTGIKGAGQLPPFFAVDQEGGQISRLPGTDYSGDSAAMMGTLPDTQVAQLGSEMGQSMAAIGATIDFAPVVDLDNGQNTAISVLSRSFSDNPVVVTAKAGAFAQGIARTGVVPVFKHFPGLGNATGPTGGNTDEGPATAPPLSLLQQNDLVPYHALLRASYPFAVMVGNQVVPDLTDGLPASLSSGAYTLLRGQYGFHGVVLTDELLHAKAVASVQPDPAEAVIAALQAGADMPLINPDDEQTVGAIIDAVAAAVNDGRLHESQIDASLQRILTLKSAIQAAPGTATK